MMRLPIVLLVTATLAGCLGSSPPSSFYELIPMEGPSGSAKSDVSVAIGAVQLPALLDRPQLVLRLGQHERAVDEFARWAEPLGTAVPRILADNLARLLGTDRVGPSEAGSSSDFVVEVTVTRFDATVDGNAVLSCRWWLMDGDRNILTVRSGRYSATPPSPAMADIVGALNATLDDLSTAIADAIRSAG